MSNSPTYADIENYLSTDNDHEFNWDCDWESLGVDEYLIDVVNDLEDLKDKNPHYTTAEEVDGEEALNILRNML